MDVITVCEFLNLGHVVITQLNSLNGPPFPYFVLTQYALNGLLFFLLVGYASQNKSHGNRRFFFLDWFFEECLKASYLNFLSLANVLFYTLIAFDFIAYGRYADPLATFLVFAVMGGLRLVNLLMFNACFASLVTDSALDINTRKDAVRTIQAYRILQGLCFFAILTMNNLRWPSYFDKAPTSLSGLNVSTLVSMFLELVAVYEYQKTIILRAEKFINPKLVHKISSGTTSIGVKSPSTSRKRSAAVEAF